MAGVITTGNFPKALWPGVKAWWGRFYNEHPKEYEQLFDMDTSTQSYEEDVQATGFGLAPVKAQGAAVQYDSETQGYTSRYTNVSYALGFVITREEMDDNLYAKVGKTRTRALAFSMSQTLENVHANVYNRAFNNSYTGGDGLELCSTAHVTASGNQSNELTTAADLSEASLEDLLINIMNAKNDRGLRISLMPKTLIVPPALVFDAERILNSNLRSNSANNDANAIKNLGLIPGGVVVNHYLTDTDAFFVRTNAPESMKSYIRQAVEMSQDNDFDTENFKAKVFCRFVPGWSDWRGVYGSPGA